MKDKTQHGFREKAKMVTLLIVIILDVNVGVKRERGRRTRQRRVDRQSSLGQVDDYLQITPRAKHQPAAEEETERETYREIIMSPRGLGVGGPGFKKSKIRTLLH